MWSSRRQTTARMTAEPANPNQNGAVVPHVPAITPPIAAPATRPIGRRFGAPIAPIANGALA